MSSLIRQLKLHALMGAKALTYDRVSRIKDFFDTLFDGMQIEVIPEYDANKVIFHKGGKFYMEEDHKNGRLRCKWNGYWSFFENDLGLDYGETQAVIRHMVEKHIKQQVSTPLITAPALPPMVEKHLKQHVSTPIDIDHPLTDDVERHIRQRS